MAFRYIFDDGRKKFTCPNCIKKTFVPYIDVITGEYLPEEYGRCDREVKCSSFLNPYGPFVGVPRNPEGGPYESLFGIPRDP